MCLEILAIAEKAALWLFELAIAVTKGAVFRKGLTLSKVSPKTHLALLDQSANVLNIVIAISTLTYERQFFYF